MKRAFVASKAGLVVVSPLTPALSPLRGEGARRASLIRVMQLAAFAAFWLFEAIQSELAPTRRRAAELRRAPNASPSPLNGLRAEPRRETGPSAAGVRGETVHKAHPAAQRYVGFCWPILLGVGCLLGIWSSGFGAAAAVATPPRPNIVFILADDLGYGEIGCYGQTIIQTPRIDRMAREGMRFTQFYAGATVCAPSRSVLMTGQHHGHTRVRGNAGKAEPLAQSLRSNDVTVAKVLQAAGYRTALIGKWGLGDVGAAEVGLPRRHGFDYFFGYLNQHHAHNHYPDYLWRNEEKVPLPNDRVPVGDQGGGYATNGTVYADDLLADEAVKFIGQSKAQPFFLFLSLVVPHANNERNRELKNGAEVPDFGPYADKPWPSPDKGHAAMITRMDGYVGRVLDELKRLKLEQRTLVIFTSDNGPHKESGHDAERFRPSGPLRGYKRELTDGGIRVPFIAWWPGTVKAGKVSEHVGYFGDFMATGAELGRATAPTNLDSISFAPALLGRTRDQGRHEFLYFEFHEGGFSQAVILDGRWKGIRTNGSNGSLQLYDLKNDLGETRNIAMHESAIVEKIEAFLRTARSESTDWPVRRSASGARNSSAQRQRASASFGKPVAVVGTASGEIETMGAWMPAGPSRLHLAKDSVCNRRLESSDRSG